MHFLYLLNSRGFQEIPCFSKLKITNSTRITTCICANTYYDINYLIDWEYILIFFTTVLDNLRCFYLHY